MLAQLTKHTTDACVKPDLELLINLLDWTTSSLGMMQSSYTILEQLLLRRNHSKVLAFYVPITKRLKAILQANVPNKSKVAALSFLGIFACAFGNVEVFDSIRGLDRVALNLL